MDRTSKVLLEQLYRTLDASMHALIRSPLLSDEVELTLLQLEGVNEEIGQALLDHRNEVQLHEVLRGLEGRVQHIMLRALDEADDDTAAQCTGFEVPIKSWKNHQQE